MKTIETEAQVLELGYVVQIDGVVGEFEVVGRHGIQFMLRPVDKIIKISANNLTVVRK